MPLVKYYLGEAYKLKGFLTQIKIKIINKGLHQEIFFLGTLSQAKIKVCETCVSRDFVAILAILAICSNLQQSAQ